MKKFTRNEARGFLVSSKEELFTRIVDALEILEKERDKKENWSSSLKITEAIAILRGSNMNYYEDEISVDEV